MVLLAITPQDPKTSSSRGAKKKFCTCHHTTRRKDIILSGSEHTTVAMLQDTKTSHTSSTNTVPEQRTQQRAAVQEGDQPGWRQGLAEVAPPRYHQWHKYVPWRTGPGHYTAHVLSWQQQGYTE